MRFTIFMVVAVLLLPTLALGQVSHPASEITPGNFSASGNFAFKGVVYFGDMASAILPAGPGQAATRLTDQTGAPVLYLKDGKVGIGTTPSYKLHVSGDIYADSGWVRVSGTNGLYFETYGGGWYASDNSWVRAYQDRGVYTAGEVQAGTIRGNSNLCIGNDCKTAWSQISGLCTQIWSKSVGTGVNANDIIAVPDKCKTFEGCKITAVNSMSGGCPNTPGQKLKTWSDYSQDPGGKWGAIVSYAGMGGNSNSMSPAAGTNGDGDNGVLISASSCAIYPDYHTTLNVQDDSSAEQNVNQWTVHYSTQVVNTFNGEIWVCDP